MTIAAELEIETELRDRAQSVSIELTLKVALKLELELTVKLLIVAWRVKRTVGPQTHRSCSEQAQENRRQNSHRHRWHRDGAKWGTGYR